MKGPQLMAARSRVCIRIWLYLGKKKKKSVKHTLSHHLKIQVLAGGECQLLQALPLSWALAHYRVTLFGALPWSWKPQLPAAGADPECLPVSHLLTPPSAIARKPEPAR